MNQRLDLRSPKVHRSGAGPLFALSAGSCPRSAPGPRLWPRPARLSHRNRLARGGSCLRSVVKGLHGRGARVPGSYQRGDAGARAEVHAQPARRRPRLDREPGRRGRGDQLHRCRCDQQRYPAAGERVAAHDPGTRSPGRPGRRGGRWRDAGRRAAGRRRGMAGAWRRRVPGPWRGRCGAEDRGWLPAAHRVPQHDLRTEPGERDGDGGARGPHRGTADQAPRPAQAARPPRLARPARPARPSRH